ncbi:F-box protein At5g07610-like [Gossypium arboreum]|uniref:F-box protein At5g07610-like n=1 Tax=Gossypium arboreum TaxID=29729 RepID=UPI000818FBF2|nr:F-box protein At5g07610-like [Gossypium arboreum]
MLNISDDPDSNFMSLQIEIYSSQTRSWRLSGKSFLAHVNTEFGGGVFCNGAIHWLGAWNNTSFYFNVQDEELRDLPMPPIPDDWEDLRQCRYFGESQNHLHLIEIYRPPTTRFTVYEIESDYSGWEADDEESYMVLHIPEKAIHYNLKDGSFKKICDLDADENGYKGSPVLISLTYFWAHHFIQTLSRV